MSEDKKFDRKAYKEKSENHAAQNREAYAEKNVKKTETKEREIQTVTNKLKTKKIEVKTYKNGVKKSRLISVTSNK